MDSDEYLTYIMIFYFGGQFYQTKIHGTIKAKILLIVGPLIDLDGW